MENIPLVVDLDGTLLHSNLLDEGIIILLRKNPLYLFSLLIWLLKGKVYFKNQIFKKVLLPYDLLPWNKELLSFLKTEFQKGRKLILATASLKSNADEICKQFPIFDETFGTREVNLKGRNKSKILIDKFGKFRFDYIGNSNSDLVIFASSRYSYLVNPRKSLIRKTKKVSNIQYIWTSQSGFPFLYHIKAIRAYQWIKNILIFVPLITSHSFYSLSFIEAIEAFFAFSFVASSGYLINDLLDLESDRNHLHKRNRPFASGKLSIPTGAVLVLVLFAAGLLLASLLNFKFLIILLFYFVTSFSYSIFLKRKALYDVFILALLYSLRVIAGAVVIDVSLSSWLIAFSTFLFLSLALVKRCSELIQVENTKRPINKGRKYSIEDINLLQTMGIVSGFLSVIVFSLYIDSSEVALLYSRPQILWIVSFLFLFWISHIWLVTAHGEMTDDPIIYAIKDKTSYLIFLVIGLILFFSI